MGTFTSRLEIITRVLGSDPVVCEIDKPEMINHQIHLTIRSLADAILADAPRSRIDELLENWSIFDQVMEQYRNYCRLGQIISLVNAGVIDPLLMTQLNSLWWYDSSIFHLFGITLHPQYYFVCEIDSLTVSLDVLPGVVSLENIVVYIRQMIDRGQQHLVANLLYALLD